MKQYLLPSLLLLLKLTHSYDLNLSRNVERKDVSTKVLKVKDLLDSREVLLFAASFEDGFHNVLHEKTKLWSNEKKRCSYVKVFYTDEVPLAAKFGLSRKDKGDYLGVKDTSLFMLNVTPGLLFKDTKGVTPVWKTVSRKEFWEFVKKTYDVNYAHPNYEKDEKFPGTEVEFEALEPTTKDLEESELDDDDVPEIVVDAPKGEGVPPAVADDLPDPKAPEAPKAVKEVTVVKEVKEDLPEEKVTPLDPPNLRREEVLEPVEVEVKDQSSFLTSTLLLPALLVGAYSLY